jgi:hypothetical protein
VFRDGSRQADSRHGTRLMFGWGPGDENLWMTWKPSPNAPR